MNTVWLILGTAVICTSLALAVALYFYARCYGVDRLRRARDHADVASSTADVTVVIPARNEQQAIAACLSSILPERVVGRIIVVDDHSSDATAQVVRRIAEEDRRVELVAAPELPEGWLGKNHALQVGGSLCNTEYVLFTDADVQFRGEVISLVRDHMREHVLDHVGGMFGIECGTTAEKVCGPVLAAIAFLALSASARSRGAGTGAFNMLRASTYRRLGGHSGIRNRIVDDVSLARLVKKNGYATAFVDLSQQVRVRLFVGFPGYWGTVSRSAIPFLNRSLPLASALALVTLSLAVIAAACPVAGFFSSLAFLRSGDAGHGWLVLLLCSVYLVAAIPFLGQRQCHNGRRLWALGFPLALFVMVFSVIASIWRILQRKPLVWREREYVGVR